MKKITLNQGEININNFKKINRISRGGFGVVYKVEEIKTGKFFAAKVIDCDDDEEKCKEMIKREISIMINVNHPTIIKFIGYSKVDFHDENNITIIMELATNGSLKDVLKKIQEHDGPKDYTNTTRQMILIGVSRGMKYLHDRNIIHRDLKTDNILLDDNFHPHITDFGLSKSYDIGHSHSQTKFGGTLIYEAPEILRKEKYGIKVDVYSFGILMYEVLTDCVPYPELEAGEIAEYKFINNVIKKNYRPKFLFPVKKSFKDLIERCWSDDPNERPTFSEIFNKLSNKMRETDDHEEVEDFLLDDVDVEELKLYVEDVTDATDFTEKLLNRMSEMEKENQKLKEVNKKLYDELDQTKQELDKCKSELNHFKDMFNGTKSDEKQYIQSIIVGGYDYSNQLGEKPNNKVENGCPIISPPVKLSFDPSSLLSYSVFCDHSVIITSDGSLKGIGNNSDGRISSTLQKAKIEDFTDYCIKDSSGHQLTAVSAVCYQFGTLYLLSKSSGNDERQLVLCDCEINEGDPVFLDIGNHQPVSLFGGFQYLATIDSEGEVIFINHNSVKCSQKSPIASFSLPDGEKASSVACCDDSIVVLSSNGRVFESPAEIDSTVLNFSVVSELSDQEIVCVSGTCDHFLAVSKEGRVFGRGSNECGELGLGKETESVSSFTKISSLLEYEIRAAYAGWCHSLFETREGKILSCGSDEYGGLLLSGVSCENVYSPTETTITSGASFCIAGHDQSAVFIGSGAPPNTPNLRIQQYDDI